MDSIVAYATTAVESLTNFDFLWKLLKVFLLFLWKLFPTGLAYSSKRRNPYSSSSLIKQYKQALLAVSPLLGMLVLFASAYDDPDEEELRRKKKDDDHIVHDSPE